VRGRGQGAQIGSGDVRGGAGGRVETTGQERKRNR
jgi:hypothetical protein